MEIEEGSGADLGSSSNECAQVPEIRYMMDQYVIERLQEDSCRVLLKIYRNTCYKGHKYGMN